MNIADGIDPIELVEDPRWIPFRYDDARGAMAFARLDREEQRRITFLDPRHVRPELVSRPVAVDRLPADRVPEAAAPQFVFHTSFCCSTLLARAVDAPGHAMGVKEPAILADFANVWLHGRPSARTEAALALTLRLLGRPLGAGEVQVVKPSNVVNAIAPLLMKLSPESRAVVMHSSLSAFLHAIRRGGEATRTFGRLLLMNGLDAERPGVQTRPPELFGATDLQASALGWLMQARSLADLPARAGAGRTHTLSSDRFLVDKITALDRVSGFFGLGVPPDAWRTLAAGPLFNEHAKRLGESFDATVYAASEHASDNEVRPIVDWAMHEAERLGWPVALGDTLMSANAA